MKSRKLICVAAITFTVLAILLPLAAREGHAQHHHYKLIDVGTFGGPNSSVDDGGAPLSAVLNDRGAVACVADTAMPDPHAGNPNPVIGSDGFVNNACRWRDGVLTDL